MKNRISFLFFGILIISILVFTAACAPKSNDAFPSSSVDEPSAEVQLNGPGDSTPSDAGLPESPNPDTPPKPSPAAISPDAAVS
ncbi:MAG TPA: hypothetical protein VIO64_09855 [Pseudobacteroides sp.]|uniref:hypothetical protein n=1 Tax=Pseudobacteroides sp. TaxID=1968840 RepID=UPI002F957BC7